MKKKSREIIGVQTFKMQIYKGLAPLCALSSREHLQMLNFLFRVTRLIVQSSLKHV